MTYCEQHVALFDCRKNTATSLLRQTNNTSPGVYCDETWTTWTALITWTKNTLSCQYRLIPASQSQQHTYSGNLCFWFILKLTYYRLIGFMCRGKEWFNRQTSCKWYFIYIYMKEKTSYNQQSIIIGTLIRPQFIWHGQRMFYAII